jgi:Peptidase family C25
MDAKRFRRSAILLGLALLSCGNDSATAQTCVDDVTGVSNVCTANDVSLTSVIVTNVVDGCVSASDTATVDLQATLQSGTTRYDIGIFLARDGGNAFTGSCIHDYFGPLLAVPPGQDPSSGVGPYADLEGAQSDACGDIVTGELTARNINGVSVSCSDTDLDGFVDIGNCLSWDNKSSNNCANVSQAVPGTKSKCNCTRINTNLGIPNIQLTKNCSPDTAHPGDTVSCTITYQNTGTGPGDYISFVDDYSQTQGTVSNLSGPGGDTVVDDGDTITWTPGGAPATQANISPGASGTLTYDFTLAGSLSNGEMIPNTVTAHWQGIAQSALSASEVTNVVTTAALVSSFEVYAAPEGRVVVWATVSESRTAGFFVERWDADANRFVRLNRDPVPAVLQPQGGVYRLVDESPQPASAFLYRLIEVEFDGRELIIDSYRRALSRNPDRSALAAGGGFSSRARLFPPERRKGASPRTASLRQYKLKHETRVKLYLRESGIYRVTDAEIAEASGLSLIEVRDALHRGRVRLERRGRSIPWLESTDGTSLAFYAPPFDRTFTLEDVVWLDLDFGSRLRPSGRARPRPRPRSSSFEAESTFAESLRVEEDQIAAVALGKLDPLGDFWFWSFVPGSPGEGQDFDFLVSDPGSASSQSKLIIDFQGFAEGAEHAYAVTLNGVDLGEARFVGDVHHSASFDVDSAVLKAGTNRLGIRAAADAAPFIGAFLDGFTLDYPRHYRAVGGRLAFQGADEPVVTISGFTSPDLSVWDVSDPELPRPLPVLVDGADADWSVTLQPTPGALYLASATSAYASPSRWESVPRSRLRAAVDGVNYVIIVPREMEAEAQSFAEYRARSGFRPLVATVEDIQDEFTDGIADPRAIREFLRLLRSRLTPGDTGYVLLAGKGTYDYRDLLGAGTNLVPPLLLRTQSGLVASDYLLADVVGDDLVPDLAIGRVPAVGPEELRTYFDKIRLFESAPPDAPWRSKLIFVADNDDPAGNFASDSDALMRIVPRKFESVPILLGQTHTADGAREAILQSWNQGALFVSYVGHASMIHWASEDLFDTAAAASLENGARLPLVMGLSCYMGRFDFPTIEPLAAVALLSPKGGAAAVLSPSGASVDFRATRIGTTFVERVLGGGRTVGQSMVETFLALRSDEAMIELLDTYNLLGDPAIRLTP